MRDEVQDYYGKTLSSSEDLQTDACCTAGGTPEHLKPILSKIHDEVMSRYYGCGLIAPDHLEGAHILDLGSGSGRDCYVLSALVGEQGSVTGVDMTREQLEVAERHVEYHREVFGYRQGNVRFLHGFLEQLHELELKQNHFDIIVSNCVLNLCTDKAAVLRQAYELLKPGGELYFSDVYCDRRVPDELTKDPVLFGECLSGALYWNDFVNLAKQAGFADPRLVEDRPLTIDNPKLEQKVGNLRFFSATYRLFKLDGLEPACEDYGQAVRYKGTIPNAGDRFVLDKHHVIETGRVFPVCGNTYRMLHDTRFRPHFDFYGDWSIHYGIFDGCGTSLPFDSVEGDGSASAGGCC
ncbi:methyltransferase type 11 [Hahella sp. CCB-MM4]|uniref:methyltransferase domain-containing protein n=1 Tax=Hahella sp. (strain CCB-MM4) TaxID=1926491 RepID=UPI000B9C38F5|nr:methyltransferase domain-containing protein [Hahella sp. CCB-MM4]OZG73114.1 methyltransferase type 11 [Hahella sp. CCB-MM4]